MSDILSLDSNGLTIVKKSISISTGLADANKLVETDPLTGKLGLGVLPPTLTTLDSPLSGFTPTADLTDLTSLTTILSAFAKLQAQVSSKDSLLRIEYLTGTTVLSTAQNAAIIDSLTDCNIFLPVGIDNQKYRLRNVGIGKATFVPNGSNTIEKQSSYLLLTSNAFDLVFLNNNWFIF